MQRVVRRKQCGFDTRGGKVGVMDAGSAERGSRAARTRRVKKYSVSLPEDLAESIREQVGSGEFSAYVAKTLQRQAERDGLAEIVTAYEAENGPVAPEHVSRAEDAFAQAARKEAAWQAQQTPPEA